MYVRPPKILVDYGIIDKCEVWRLEKALYGLRVSPRLRGKERDNKLAALPFGHDGVMYKLNRSHIDPSLWTIHEDNGCEFLHQIVPAGFLRTYVDDFLVAGETRLRMRIDASWRRWRRSGRRNQPAL